MKTILNIEGMSCGHCVNAVTAALKGVAGVISAETSLEEKCACIEHDDTVSIDALKAAIIDEGYQIA
jgi:copper chaperone CopZ